ncbi:hypothetical protein QR680_016303 [Steinernema hermaphroditum]|uniref:Uncharacterized protein n=1 Tax=Steinernema hermaphroditum TaxID=289476 RepID=A0AA39LM43_9BILA|nr:hypothetical protein QR680_016303 [Steinernema hermaphroditum]
MSPPIKGCRSCLTEAEMTISCNARGTTTEEVMDVVECDQNGVSRVSTNTDLSRIEEDCVVQCPGGKTDMSLFVNDPKVKNHIWVPDLYFANARTAEFHDVTVPNFNLFITQDGTIAYSSRVTLNVACNLQLMHYPMDRQTCMIRLLSYAYIASQINVTWFSQSPVRYNPQIGLPEFLITGVDQSYCNGTYVYAITERSYKIDQFSCLEGNIHLSRSIGYHLVQSYIPTGLIVIISWVSFWIDRRAVPARVTLSFTTMLSLSTLGNGLRFGLPQVSYAKAIDYWFGFCLIFVFGSLLEFAIVNSYMRQSDKYEKLAQTMKKKQSIWNKNHKSDAETKPLAKNSTIYYKDHKIMHKQPDVHPNVRYTQSSNGGALSVIKLVDVKPEPIRTFSNGTPLPYRNRVSPEPPRTYSRPERKFARVPLTPNGNTSCHSDTDDDSPSSTEASAAEKLIAEDHLQKLTRTVELISGYDSSWTQYIHSLAGSAAKTEEELHEAWLDKEDGFPVQVDAAHEAIDYITSKLREFERALFGATPSSPSPTVALSREPTPAPAPFSRSARLSDIPLETFDGNIKKWPEFWAMFSLIHDDPTVNAVVKLSELKRLLRGDAKLALEGLPLKKENYGVAVELLRTTYGSTEQLKTELYHELCSLPPVSDRADDLSRFVLKVKRICLQLESLGEDVNTTLTAQMVYGKLPTKVVVELISSKQSLATTAVASVEEVHTFVARETTEEVLQLGHATFVNPDTPEIASQYVAFLDSGSNRSFILPEVAEALKLRPKRHLTLVVNAFRSTTAQRFQVSKVQLAIRFKDGSDHVFTAYVTDRGKDRSDELAVMVVDSTLEKFWSLETLGIRDDPVEKDDDVARRILREGIRKVGDRYEASLLWNTDNPQLPDNLELCMRRLQSVCGSLSKRPEGLRAYDKVLREHIADGTVAKHTSAVGHCLPHHAVYKAGKEEPRIVFDASAKPRKNAHSLNERLYRGPVSLPALAGIILRSRIPPTVCWADVKKAFHQILLREEDKQFVCFMWPKDIQKPPSWENVEFYHFEVIAKAIGRKLLTADQFMTVLAQIEAIVNSRPLGYLYNDLESGQPVRPIDLITPGAQLGWPASDMEEGDETYLPPDADSSERVLAQAAAVSQALDQSDTKGCIRTRVHESLHRKATS